MQRLHARPVFAAKQAAGASEAMKRLHADPELAAKKAAAHSILTEAIITALRVDPNATRVAQQSGVVARTVLRIAKAAGVNLTRGRPRWNGSEPPASGTDRTLRKGARSRFVCSRPGLALARAIPDVANLVAGGSGAN